MFETNLQYPQDTSKLQQMSYQNSWIQVKNFIINTVTALLDFWKLNKLFLMLTTKNNIYIYLNFIRPAFLFFVLEQ